MSLVSIARYMVETNQNFHGEQCVSNYDIVVAFSDEYNQIVWKSLRKTLLWHS